MTLNEIQSLFNEESTRGQNGASTNAEAIAQVYYEYHGKHDDGNSPADGYFIEEVNVA